MIPNPGTIAFRADASPEMGLGHVLRCQTLALVLQKRDHTCHFVCAELPDALSATLIAADIAVHMLDQHPDAPSDADQTAQILRRISASLLVLDHYAHDANWTRAVGDDVTHVVIDDLANRPHNCALLVDQNLGREAADYDGFLGPRTRRLIGPRFALLRSDFQELRAQSLYRRAQIKTPQSIMISMGGMDAANATSAALRGIAAINSLSDALEVTVVMGAQAPHLAQVQNLATDMPYATTVRVDVRDMAAQMARADLAIGAAGGTAWERCVLGLPTLVAVVADNQKLGAQSLDRAGAALLLSDLSEQGFADAFEKLARKPDLLHRMSQAAARLCDGHGANRVAAAIDALSLRVRPATIADAKPIFDWRGDAASRQYFENTDATLWADHLCWFETALDNPQRALLMIEMNGVAVCHIRLDRDAATPSHATVSIVLSPEIRGRGLSVSCLQKAIDFEATQGLARINARVHHDNEASNRLFLAAGFRRGADTDQGAFALYLLDLGTASNR